MATPPPAKSGGAGSSSARRPLAVTAGEKIIKAQSLRDEAQSLLEQKPKKAAVKFRTVFAYTKGLIPATSELAVYAVATGQQTVIDGEQQVAVRALELSCNEGLAAIYFRSGDHEKALRYSDKVLLAEPESAKALFRSGQLNLRLKNIDAAKRCLTRAAKHEPQNVNILKELRNLTKLAHEQDSGSGSGGDATDAAPAAGAGRAAANAATEGSASAGDKRKCPKDIEET